MRVIITIIGLLTILGGLWPLIKDQNWIPVSLQFIPSAGIAYQLIIVGIGVLGVLYGLRKRRHYRIR